MFILEQEAFADNTHENIQSFVNFWWQFRNKSPKDFNGEEINYADELHLNQNLTQENIRKLLRWKSQPYLTHENKQGEPNPIVQRVIKAIKIINSFRQGQITDSAFLNFTEEIFRTRSSSIYRAFLFHIARPADYPIWDQHVARVYALLTKRENAKDWQRYMEYRPWFARLKSVLKIDDELTTDNMLNTKRLDDALMAYGQFLAIYSKGVNPEH